MLKAETELELYDILSKADVSVEVTGHDNWDGGQELIEVRLAIDIVFFVTIKHRLQIIQERLFEKFSSLSSLFLKKIEITNIKILPVVEKENPDVAEVTVSLSGWEKIERAIREIGVRQKGAIDEEQFMAVGLLCRELIVTLAQHVFVKEKHPILDGVEVSETDSKRMLEAFIASEWSGSSNETLRRYARATLDLANQLTHKRNATTKDTALCATATISLLNLIGIMNGRT